MGIPLFLQSRQVAEILGIKTTTLADWRRRGWIHYIRKGGDSMGRGGSVYYRRADVLAAMNAEFAGQPNVQDDRPFGSGQSVGCDAGEESE